MRSTSLKNKIRRLSFIGAVLNGRKGLKGSIFERKRSVERNRLLSPSRCLYLEESKVSDFFDKLKLVLTVEPVFTYTFMGIVVAVLFHFFNKLSKTMKKYDINYNTITRIVRSFIDLYKNFSVFVDSVSLLMKKIKIPEGVSRSSSSKVSSSKDFNTKEFLSEVARIFGDMAIDAINDAVTLALRSSSVKDQNIKLGLQSLLNAIHKDPRVVYSVAYRYLKYKDPNFKAFFKGA